MSGRRNYLNLRHKISHLLNPAICQICGIPITSDKFYCAHCQSSFHKVAKPCSLCGLPNQASGTTCPICLLHPPRWQSMCAPLIYSAVTRAQIHQFKFQSRIEIARLLIHDLLLDDFQNRAVDVLLPVPLHVSRLVERGFNQSQEIARVLSKYLSIPLDSQSLKRVKATEPQSGLSPNKRKLNLRKAFSFNPTVNYQSVAIIDDVITSASTMTEICKLLQRSGIPHIEVWSLARTLKHH